MSSANLGPVPYFTVLDSSGNPVSGGKIYTYLAGTTTPQNTYTDRTAATPNANPVVADSSGRATIFFDDSIAYKLVVKDASDVTLVTIDNYSVNPVILKGTTLTISGNGTVGGTFGATGATTLSSTLAVTGAATLSSTLAVTGIQTFTAETKLKRIRATQATALVAADFALSAGWGTTASVGSVAGTDQGWTMTVTSSGTGQAANPTITLTFKDGTWTNAPITVTKMAGGTGTLTSVTDTPAPTNLLITFQGTPVAGSTYTFNSIAMGR